MKNNPLSFITAALIVIIGMGGAIVLLLILGVGAYFITVRISGEQPMPVDEYSSAAPIYEPVQVDQVEAEVGFGSPISVQVSASGSLPNSCAQIELVQQEKVRSNFKLSLSTLASTAEGCIQDTLPFRIRIPLNMTNIAAGEYFVEVNGSQTSFVLETGNTTSSLPTANSTITKSDIQVESVNVEIGVGSLFPVHAIVGLSLPNSCAQLGEVRLHRDGNIFYVRLIADLSERADCRVDSIPFRMEIPLNIVNLPEGPYEVNVNGVTASFDPPTAHANLLITLERTACFGTCPIYALTIYEDGRVEYVGQDFVTAKGEQTGSITPEKLQELVAAFQNADYFNLQDEYTAPITDLPTTITSFTFDGTTKTIRNYGGCLDNMLVPAPQALCELENKIDEVTKSAQWVGK